jgi:hypothetical protein
MFHFTCDADIERVGRGLLDRSLPKPEWTHAAHFAAAFWLLKHPTICAAREMPDLIRAYNEATGTPNTDSGGYHETITVASLRAARAWLAKRAGMPLHEAHGELMKSTYGRSDWLLEYWSRPVLFSVMARRHWVEPDLRPLPF